MSKDKLIRLCKCCNQPFEPTANNQMYCKRPHFMNCPICGNPYLVKNNANLKRPPVACSCECRKVRMEHTSMERYGIKTPGNNPEARAKSKQTMQEKYGVDYALASKEINDKAKQTMLEKYGVDNIQKLSSVAQAARKTSNANWIKIVHSEFPIKMISRNIKNIQEIDDNNVSVYVIRDNISNEFLAKYGFQIAAKPGRIHLSLGLVHDNVLYQVIRFERHDGQIVLTNLGIKDGFCNPNNYDKLIKFAVDVKGIDSFKAFLPRYLATKELLSSLSVKKIKDGQYNVFWILEDGRYKALTRRDNIIEMKSKYDYITTDFLDEYEFINKDNVSEIDLELFK